MAERFEGSKNEERLPQEFFPKTDDFEDRLGRGEKKFGIDKKTGVKTEQWQEEDFDLGKELRVRKGPFVEIAGPTEDGYDRIDLNSLDRKVFQSNVKNGSPIYGPEPEENPKPIGYFGKVDFMADATKLPLADGKVGALFGSCLPREIRAKAIKEALRILEPGGFFVSQGFWAENIDLAQKLGFRVREYTKDIYPPDPFGGEAVNVYSVILQKPKPKPR